MLTNSHVSGHKHLGSHSKEDSFHGTAGGRVCVALDRWRSRLRKSFPLGVGESPKSTGAVHGALAVGRKIPSRAPCPTLRAGFSKRSLGCLVRNPHPRSLPCWNTTFRVLKVATSLRRRWKRAVGVRDQARRHARCCSSATSTHIPSGSSHGAPRVARSWLQKYQQIFQVSGSPGAASRRESTRVDASRSERIGPSMAVDGRWPSCRRAVATAT